MLSVGYRWLCMFVCDIAVHGGRGRVWEGGCARTMVVMFGIGLRGDGEWCLVVGLSCRVLGGLRRAQ